MNRTAEITDIGPISRLALPIPEGGGIVVLKGANGCGKSTALNTIDAAVSKRGTVPLRDGAIRGEFSGFGIRMTIGRSTRRQGEAEVHTLEGRLDVAAVVDPGIADAEKADAHRIRALVNLIGAHADATLFYPLVGGAAAFDAVVSPAAMTHGDLLSMAGAVKRDLEAAARKSAAEAGNAKGRADASRKSAELPDTIDPDQETDAKVLQRELEQAAAAKAKVESDQQAAERATRLLADARQHLERAERSYTGPTVEEASEAEAQARTARNVAQESLREAERSLELAKANAVLANRECSARLQALESAQQHAATVESWRQQIDAAANLPPVKPGDIVRARAAVDDARERLEQAALIRRARAATAEADQLEELSREFQTHVDRMREAARGVDDVLSGVVAKSGVPLRIEPVDGRIRLTVETARTAATGRRTPFAELSDGERWQKALAIAIQAVGRGGELTVPQHAWEGLDPAARAAIAEQLRAGGVIAFTAEASDGELRAEVFGANGEAA